jgi:hypothetical protein
VLVLLLGGYWRGWVQPSFGGAERPTALYLGVPGLAGQRVVSIGSLLIVTMILVVVSMTAWGRQRLALSEVTAILGVGITLSFLASASLVDGALRAKLDRNAQDKVALQQMVRFPIPRPNITTLGPLPLNHQFSLIFSALRSGFYLTLLATILLVATAAARRRDRPRDRDASAWATAALLIVALAIPAASTIQGLLAAHAIKLGEQDSAKGNDAAAAQHFKRALQLDGTLRALPDTAASRGQSLLRLGVTDDADAQLARARLELGAGLDTAALKTLSTASARWPSDVALRSEFVSQGLQFIAKRGAAEQVHQVLPQGVTSPVLRIAMAKAELAEGDNPQAAADARAAAEVTDDEEIRSVALTLLSIAQSRSGDAVGGRLTLLRAVQADSQSVNVIARSLLTGLYTTVPLP